MARRPRVALLGLEAARAGREFGMYVGSRRTFANAPRGDGHPVLVMPGLLGGDGSTRAARTFLRSLGYSVHAWKLGRNWGPTDRITDGLGQRFRALVEQHDRKISLVGHSLGGIYARELARRSPGMVRGVITLGSPIRLVQRSTLSVPVTAILTQTDGVVPWDSCVVEAGPRQECIVVKGSHSGLIHNPAALLVVADRLAQPEGSWTPYVERDGVGARIFVPRH